MAEYGGFLKYVKKAFLFHWNLLAVGAGTAIAVISGRPDVILPIVTAGEVLFLAALASNQRFQESVDAGELKAKRTDTAAESAQKMRLMLISLSSEDRNNYERLRALCIQLRRIAQGIAGVPQNENEMIDDLHSTGINKLLWIYLKLLYSKNALEKFFRTTNENEIKSNVEILKNRIAEMGPAENDTPAAAKNRKSIEDTLRTSELRLNNYKLARENYEFIGLELGRLYSKIATLSEMSINRRDPDFITSEVDQVSASVQQTEKAMNDLEFITGLSSSTDEMPPAMLYDQQTLTQR